MWHDKGNCSWIRGEALMVARVPSRETRSIHSPPSQLNPAASVSARWLGMDAADAGYLGGNW